MDFDTLAEANAAIQVSKLLGFKAYCDTKMVDDGAGRDRFKVESYIIQIDNGPKPKGSVRSNQINNNTDDIKDLNAKVKELEDTKPVTRQWEGTLAQYKAIAEPDPEVLYKIRDESMKNLFTKYWLPILFVSIQLVLINYLISVNAFSNII